MPRTAPRPVIAVPDDAFGDVAHLLVQSGRVVPGLTIDADGRARSWWWPLPARSVEISRMARHRQRSSHHLEVTV